MWTAIYATLVAVTAAWVVLRVLLPRMAHGAFTRGEVRRAAWLFRLQRALSTSRGRRAAHDVSIAGCLCAAGDFTGAAAVLARAEPAVTDSSTRAAWLNNRAYVAARAGSPEDAVRDADAAVSLRPDVASFRHTRGLALFAAARTDEAIAELDGIWALGGEAPPLLEAERCYDLGVAWAKKGERDYAADYFARASRVAPGSTWARKAEAVYARERRP